MLSSWEIEKYSPCMNNFFTRIPLSQEDKIHEHIQVSLVLGRRTKGNLACCFHSFCRFSKRAFSRTSPTSTGRNGWLKPGKLLYLIGHIENQTRQFYHSYNIWGAQFFRTPGVFYSPGEVIHKIDKTRDQMNNPSTTLLR